MRPWLVKTCELLECTVPMYKNPQEYTILQGTIDPLNDNKLSFKATFSNDAPFAQAYPTLKLKLLKFNGAILAERNFAQRQYAPTVPFNKKVPPGGLVNINFQIANPSEKIGGYSFELH